MSSDRFKVEKAGEGLYRLDVRGLVCPYPQLLVMRALSGLSQNDILEVILDNPPSVRDIPPILEERGYNVNVTRLDSATWKIIIQTRK
ncbi:MAG: sulfurtransferase TusA family protein [Candidatus Bathyarchaeia archaeon]